MRFGIRRRGSTRAACGAMRRSVRWRTVGAGPSGATAASADDRRGRAPLAPKAPAGVRPAWLAHMLTGERRREPNVSQR